MAMTRLSNLSIGDYVLHMLNAKFGKIKKLPDIMAVYRDGVGVWSSKEHMCRSPLFLNTLGNLIVLFENDEKLACVLKQQYRELAFELYNHYKKEKDYNQAHTFFITMCANYPELVYEEYKIRINELNYIKNTIIYRFGKKILLFFPLLKKKYNNNREEFYIKSRI
jgi:hypothetical protein